MVKEKAEVSGLSLFNKSLDGEGKRILIEVVSELGFLVLL